jgi:hypothetical protein
MWSKASRWISKQNKLPSFINRCHFIVVDGKAPTTTKWVCLFPFLIFHPWKVLQFLFFYFIHLIFICSYFVTWWHLNNYLYTRLQPRILCVYVCSWVHAFSE